MAAPMLGDGNQEIATSTSAHPMWRAVVARSGQEPALVYDMSEYLEHVTDATRRTATAHQGSTRRETRPRRHAGVSVRSGAGSRLRNGRGNRGGSVAGDCRDSDGCSDGGRA